MIGFDVHTNVRELVGQYALRADKARDAVRRGVKRARPDTDRILNQAVWANFKVRDSRMLRSWRLAVPNSGVIKLIITNLMKGFNLHVTGGTIGPKFGSKLLIPINTRLGTRIGAAKFYRMVDWLRREKLTVIRGNILYVRVPMNTSRRGGVAVGQRVQKKFRARFSGARIKRPTGFDIKLNPEGLTPIAVLRPSVTLRRRFDIDAIATARIIPAVLEGVRAELDSLT